MHRHACVLVWIYMYMCVLNSFLQLQFSLDFHTFLGLILRIGLFLWTNRLLKMIPHKTQFLTPIAPTPHHSWVALQPTSECVHIWVTTRAMLAFLFLSSLPNTFSSPPATKLLRPLLLPPGQSNWSSQVPLLFHLIYSQPSIWRSGTLLQVLLQKCSSSRPMHTWFLSVICFSSQNISPLDRLPCPRLHEVTLHHSIQHILLVHMVIMWSGFVYVSVHFYLVSSSATI